LGVSMSCAEVSIRNLENNVSAINTRYFDKFCL